MKKFKVLALVLCLCTIVSVPLTSLAATSALDMYSADVYDILTVEVENTNARAVGDVLTVIVDGLRLRKTPSASGTILGLLYKGDTLIVTGSDVVADGYSWIPVYSPLHNLNGYVARWV